MLRVDKIPGTIKTAIIIIISISLFCFKYYHLAYLVIIATMLIRLVRCYDLINRQNKSLNNLHERTKVPFDIFSHYEKAYVNFYRWMVETKVSQKVIDKFDKMFKYDEDDNKSS